MKPKSYVARLAMMLVKDDRDGSTQQRRNCIAQQAEYAAKLPKWNELGFFGEFRSKPVERRRHSCQRSNSVWDKKQPWDATSSTYLKGNFGGLF